MAIIANSLVKMPNFSPEIIKKIGYKMNQLLRNSTLRDLSLICNSYVKAQIPCDDFIKNLVNHSIHLIDDQVSSIFNNDKVTINGLDISILLNSLLRLDYLTEELANKSIPLVMYMSHTFTPQSMANIIHAYAKSNVKEAALTNRLGDIAAKRAKKFNAQYKVFFI